jgi:16S rRNA (cytidine1402-2'-O)-methyltransferase
MPSVVYLVPIVLAEDAWETIPVYIIQAVKDCQVIFAENERTARRYLKGLDKKISIDSYEWFTIHKAEGEQIRSFEQKIREGKNIAIISEAGCPGVADPGQLLVARAHQLGVVIKPLVGPSSILLALMASGMNGQHFEFVGYLPIDPDERIHRIRAMESSSIKNDCTKIFIETPYRNDQLLEALLKTCNGNTHICIASELTSARESVTTDTITGWKIKKPALHKKPVIFLMHG